MDWLTYLQDKWHVDPVIVAIVIASGFFQEKYLCAFTWSKNARYDASLKTLALSAVVGLIYAYIVHAGNKTADVPAGMYFISYFLSTSLYDLIINPIRRFIKNKVGDPNPDPPKP